MSRRRQSKRLDKSALSEAPIAGPRAGPRSSTLGWRTPVAVAVVMLLLIVGLALIMGRPQLSPAARESIPEDVAKLAQPVKRFAAKSKSKIVSAARVNLATPVEPEGLIESAAATLASDAVEITGLADIVAVEVSGREGAYDFSVTIVSPDAGCDHYTDWWEVVSEDGRLLYRRVLAHSHVGEQPFTRFGGPVPVEAGTTVWVRAHMKPGGYGGRAMKGSVMSGFRWAPVRADPDVSLTKPPSWPVDCMF